MAQVLGDTHSYKESGVTVKQSVRNSLALEISDRTDDYEDSDSQVVARTGDAIRKYVFNGETPVPVLYVHNGTLRSKNPLQSRFSIYEEDSEEVERWVNEERQFEVERRDKSLEEFVDDYMGSAYIQLSEDGKKPFTLVDTDQYVAWDEILSNNWDKLDELLATENLNPENPGRDVYLEASDELFAQLVSEADPRRFESYDEMASTVQVNYHELGARGGGPYRTTGGAELSGEGTVREAEPEVESVAPVDAIEIADSEF